MTGPIDDMLVQYLAIRDQQRTERAEVTLSAMNPRERKLVREAAVMGYVRGAMAGEVAARAARAEGGGDG